MTQPNGVSIDWDGNIYVSDLDGGKVFKWMPTGEVVILAELPGRGNAHALIAGGALYVKEEKTPLRRRSAACRTAS